MSMLKDSTVTMNKVPSLVDLCVQKAIDNVMYLGDVGETDFHLLDRILPHCTLEQLMHVENSTLGRDLSPVTDKMWKKFFESEFGADCAHTVSERMRQKRVSVRWKQLYEAKVKDLDEAREKSFDRFRERWKVDDARKQSRQTQLCTKVPPSSSKRSFVGGSSFSNTKSKLMKKAKLEFVNSREVKNLAAIKKNAANNQRFCPIRKPVCPSGNSFASASRRLIIKPPLRRRV